MGVKTCGFEWGKLSESEGVLAKYFKGLVIEMGLDEAGCRLHWTKS
jgi:hypothetical protein